MKKNHLIVQLVIFLIFIFSYQVTFSQTTITVRNTYGGSDINDTQYISSLNWAIEQANSDPDLSIIEFNIPTNNQDFPIKIILTGYLNWITNPVTIDGSTQPEPSGGYNGLEPHITITNVGYDTEILLNHHSGSQIRNITVDRSHILGIVMKGGGNHIIENCVINNTFDEVGGKGINIDWSNHNTIRNNIIGTNRSFIGGLEVESTGIEIFGFFGYETSNNSILNNIIYTKNREGISISGELIDSTYTTKYNSMHQNILYRTDNSPIYEPLEINFANYDYAKPVILQVTNDVISGTTTGENDLIEIFASETDYNAEVYIGSTTAIADGTGSGTWSYNLSNADYPFYRATATDADGNTSELSLAFPYLESFDSAKCIMPFAPIPNNKYYISAWVSEDALSPQITYASTVIKLTFLLDDGTINDENTFYPQGQIIDGWQKIEGEFTVPENAVDITVSLVNINTETTSYVDDIRISPYNATMKSFVYDPVNFRFVAELDENNYATFYEYDQEGKLTRVKKETEKGIVTLKESRNHMSNISFFEQK